MRDVLHWLRPTARQRIEYRAVWLCLLGLPLVYVAELCGPTLNVQRSRTTSDQLSKVFSMSHLLATPPRTSSSFSGWPLTLEWTPFVDSHTPYNSFSGIPLST